jgi:acetate kinase
MAAVVHGGRSLDTTMAFTPAGGLADELAHGDVDPGLVRLGLHAPRTCRRRRSKSWSTSARVCSGCPRRAPTCAISLERGVLRSRAADAIAVFCYEAKKRPAPTRPPSAAPEILVFSGGIGAHSLVVRPHHGRASNSSVSRSIRNATPRAQR